MLKQKVLVVGTTGMLASALTRLLGMSDIEVTFLSRFQFDPLQQNVVNLNISGYDYIINAIGITNVWVKKYDRKTFYNVNGDFPKEMMTHCRKYNCKFIHISTDCVFNGSAGKYLETSQPTATDIYGLSKIRGEAHDGMVIRTSIVGPELFKNTSLLCWFLSQKNDVLGYENHLWNGITTIELTHLLAKIISKDLYKTGIQHIYSNDISKYSLLKLFSRHYKNKIKIVPFHKEEAVDKRLRTNDINYLELLGITPLEEQVLEMKSFTDDKGFWLDRIINENNDCSRHST